MRTVIVSFGISALLSPALFAADVAYVTFPPELGATARELSQSQIVRACDLDPKANCKPKRHIKVWGPIARDSAIALLRAIGERDGGFENIVSDGKVAKFDWSTVGGGHTEYLRPEHGSWSHVWTESIPF